MKTGLHRCGWCGTAPDYVAYHDTEWGVPEHDGRALFEKLLLDGFQAGLSWITILRKRDNYRAALDNFDAQKMACMMRTRRPSLMQDAGIVRNRLKIEAAVTNARKPIWRLTVHEAFHPNTCGGLWTARPSSTGSHTWIRCQPQRLLRKQSPRI